MAQRTGNGKGEIWRRGDAPMWYAWRYVNGHWRRRRTGHNDKRQAMVVASDWLRQGQVDEANGNVTADYASMPLADHIAQFAMENRENPKGFTQQHIERKLESIRMMAMMGGWQRTKDITLSSVQSVLQGIRERKHLPVIAAMRKEREANAEAMTPKARTMAANSRKGAKREGEAAPTTLNLYRAYIKNFTAWLDRFGRVPIDPLKALGRFRTQGAEKVRRRALSKDEQERLIRAAETGGTKATLSGPDRAMLYRFALATGFRKGECAAIRPADFIFDGPRPLVRLAGTHTKNRSTVHQPMPRWLVPMFRTWLAGRPKLSPCWPGLGSAGAAKAVASDLAKAGIVARTDEGKVDFHALRHSYITMLALAGVPIQTAQKLARHASYQLTASVYTHLGLETTGEVVDDVLSGPKVAEPLSSICAVTGGDAKRSMALRGEMAGDGAASAAEGETNDMRENIEKTSVSGEWDGRDSNPGRGDYESQASDSKSLDGVSVAAQPSAGEQDLGSRRLRAPDLSSGPRRSARERSEAGESADIDTALERIRDLGAMAGPQA